MCKKVMDAAARAQFTNKKHFGLGSHNYADANQTKRVLQLFMKSSSAAYPGWKDRSWIVNVLLYVDQDNVKRLQALTEATRRVSVGR
jgi:hypothetical protein